MKLRSFRIDDELWEAAHRQAAAEGVTLSELMRAWLEAYVRQDQATSISEELAYLVRALELVRRRVSENL